MYRKRLKKQLQKKCIENKLEEVTLQKAMYRKNVQ